MKIEFGVLVLSFGLVSCGNPETTQYAPSGVTGNASQSSLPSSITPLNSSDTSLATSSISTTSGTNPAASNGMPNSSISQDIAQAQSANSQSAAQSSGSITSPVFNTAGYPVILNDSINGGAIFTLAQLADDATGASVRPGKNKLIWENSSPATNPVFSFSAPNILDNNNDLVRPECRLYPAGATATSDATAYSSDLKDFRACPFKVLVDHSGTIRFQFKGKLVYSDAGTTLKGQKSPDQGQPLYFRIRDFALPNSKDNFGSSAADYLVDAVILLNLQNKPGKKMPPLQSMVGAVLHLELLRN